MKSHLNLRWLFWLDVENNFVIVTSSKLWVGHVWRCIEKRYAHNLFSIRTFQNFPKALELTLIFIRQV